MADSRLRLNARRLSCAAAPFIFKTAACSSSSRFSSHQSSKGIAVIRLYVSSRILRDFSASRLSCSQTGSRWCSFQPLGAQSEIQQLARLLLARWKVFSSHSNFWEPPGGGDRDGLDRPAGTGLGDPAQGGGDLDSGRHTLGFRGGGSCGIGSGKGNTAGTQFDGDGPRELSSAHPMRDGDGVQRELARLQVPERERD